MIPFAMPAVLKRVPTWAWIALGAVLLMLAFYLALDAYGDSRYREGKKDADAAWIEAGNRLVAKSQAAGAAADSTAAARAADFAAEQEAEKEKIDEALAKGGSPFDVLFNSNGR